MLKTLKWILFALSGLTLSILAFNLFGKNKQPIDTFSEERTMRHPTPTPTPDMTQAELEKIWKQNDLALETMYRENERDRIRRAMVEGMPPRIPPMPMGDFS